MNSLKLVFNQYLIFMGVFLTCFTKDLPSVFGPFDGHKSQISNVVDELHYTYYTVLHECALQGEHSEMAPFMFLKEREGVRAYQRCNITVYAQLINPWISFNNSQTEYVSWKLRLLCSVWWWYAQLGCDISHKARLKPPITHFQSDGRNMERNHISAPLVVYRCSKGFRASYSLSLPRCHSFSQPSVEYSSLKPPITSGSGYGTMQGALFASWKVYKKRNVNLSLMPACRGESS
eukprot:766329-Hanusia_phi.AAC.3